MPVFDCNGCLVTKPVKASLCNNCHVTHQIGWCICNSCHVKVPIIIWWLGYRVIQPISCCLFNGVPVIQLICGVLVVAQSVSCCGEIPPISWFLSIGCHVTLPITWSARADGVSDYLSRDEEISWWECKILLTWPLPASNKLMAFDHVTAASTQ